MNEFAIPRAGRRPVVVGVDGWEDGQRALLWAADEALRRGSELRIVHAWQLPKYGTLGPPVAPESPAHGDPIKRAVEGVLRKATESVRRRCPGLSVNATLETGEPADVLVDASRGAALTALGCRGLPGLTGLVLGAVGGRVVARAHSPVVIVRGIREHRGRVVVGVSEHLHSEQTLLAAAEMAALRGAPLHVIHVDRRHRTQVELHRHESDLRTWASDLVTAAGMTGLDVTAQVIAGDPRHELLELSLNSRLLVAGSHSHRSLIGTALGSVSGAISQEAGCPVMICPKVEAEDDEPEHPLAATSKS